MHSTFMPCAHHASAIPELYNHLYEAKPQVLIGRSFAGVPSMCFADLAGRLTGGKPYLMLTEGGHMPCLQRKKGSPACCFCRQSKDVCTATSSVRLKAARSLL